MGLPTETPSPIPAAFDATLFRNYFVSVSRLVRMDGVGCS